MKLGNNTLLKHLKQDKLPQNNLIFWDTSLPVAAVLKDKSYFMHKAAVEFIDRLVREKTYIAFSSILFDEFAHVAVMNELKKSQSSNTQARKALREKNSKIIIPHIEDIQSNMKALDEILTKFKNNFRVIFPCEPGIITKALELQCEYKLERADSFHIATMLYGSQRDIASFDKTDFGKVAGLNIWSQYNT